MRSSSFSSANCGRPWRRSGSGACVGSRCRAGSPQPGIESFWPVCCICSQSAARFLAQVASGARVPASRQPRRLSEGAHHGRSMWRNWRRRGHDLRLPNRPARRRKSAGAVDQPSKTLTDAPSPTLPASGGGESGGAGRGVCQSASGPVDVTPPIGGGGSRRPAADRRGPPSREARSRAPVRCWR